MKKKINPLTAFANPAIPSQNPALNVKEDVVKKAKAQLLRGMKGHKK